jgi:hypothetical protein
MTTLQLPLNCACAFAIEQSAQMTPALTAVARANARMEE